MENLVRLFSEGIGYQEYIGSCDEEGRQKHLHYLKKMELTEEEIRKLSAIKAEVKLLVFCNTFCNDCRITLALLENIKNATSLVQYSIVGREGHEELMRRIGGGIGIPLVIDVSNESGGNKNPLDLDASNKRTGIDIPPVLGASSDSAGLVFNEYADVVKNKIASADSDTKDRFIQEFRKGLYKNEMFQQFLAYLTRAKT